MLYRINLKNIKPKKHHKFFIIISIFFLLIIYYINNNYTYDSYNTIAINKFNNVIEITIPYTKLDMLKNDTKIIFKNKTYNIDKIKYSKPYINNKIAYEDIELTTEIKEDSEIINIKLLSNKQKLITKLKNILRNGG